MKWRAAGQWYAERQRIAARGPRCTRSVRGSPGDVLDVTLTALLAPVLVAASMLAGNRWGPRAGGVLSAFPAIVGPVLVIDLLEHGAAFTARAATGTLLGLVALSAFVAVFARLARRTGWRAAVFAGWAAAAAAGAAAGAIEAGTWTAAGAAVASLVVAAAVLPRAPAQAEAERASGAHISATALACGGLVLALAAAAGALGPTAGGVLAALPVLASVLAVATLRRRGPAATVLLLGGMLDGMAGFVAFCLAVAVLIVPAGPAVAFAVATVAAITAQLARGGDRPAVRLAAGGAPGSRGRDGAAAMLARWTRT